MKSGGLDAAVASRSGFLYAYRKAWEPALFVVRIIVDAEKSDFKAFTSLADARKRFDQGWLQTNDGEFDSIAIFEVPMAIGARDAVDAVRRGDETAIRLLKLKESRAIEMERLLASATNLDLDL